jgi:hypothetical protein
MFTLEGFNKGKSIRFARCDHRAGKRKNTQDVDCSCRLWIDITTAQIEKVVKHSPKAQHSHEVQPWRVDYHKLKREQDKMQTDDATKVI